MDLWQRSGAAEWILDVAGCSDVRTGGMGATLLRLEQMMGQWKLNVLEHLLLHRGVKRRAQYLTFQALKMSWIRTSGAHLFEHRCSSVLKHRCSSVLKHSCSSITTIIKTLMFLQVQFSSSPIHGPLNLEGDYFRSSFSDHGALASPELSPIAEKCRGLSMWFVSVHCLQM